MKQLKDMHDQSLALMVDMQPFEDSLSSFWTAILTNTNARPYHAFKNFSGRFGKASGFMEFYGLLRSSKNGSQNDYLWLWKWWCFTLESFATLLWSCHYLYRVILKKVAKKKRILL